MDIIKHAREVMNIEAGAIISAAGKLGQGFKKAVRLIHDCKGKVVVTGVGKSGIIGKKIAATLSSVGVPSCFMHSGDALLGDSGMLAEKDIVLALSYSGETEELLDLLPLFKRRVLKIISITGRTDSRLAARSDALISAQVVKEADSLDIMPTASSTLMLALGDALAVCLMSKRNLREKDFAMMHPKGIIGKRLLMKVEDVMRKGKNNPVISENKTVRDALFVMTGTRLGATSIIDSKGSLVGFFTDGDLRRKLQKDERILEKKLKNVMTKNPITITGETMAVEVLRLMKKKKFDNVPVIDGAGRPVGVVDERDLMSEGIYE